MTIILLIILSLANIVFHFTRFFVTKCKDTKEIEKYFYILAFLFSFMLFQLSLSFRKYVFSDYKNEKIFTACFAFSNMLNSLIIMILNYLKIEKEILFTIITFASFNHTLVIVLLMIILKYFLTFESTQEHEFEEEDELSQNRKKIEAINKKFFEDV